MPEFFFLWWCSGIGIDTSYHSSSSWCFCSCFTIPFSDIDPACQCLLRWTRTGVGLHKVRRPSDLCIGQCTRCKQFYRLKQKTVTDTHARTHSGYELSQCHVYYMITMKTFTVLTYLLRQALCSFRHRVRTLAIFGKSLD